MGKLTYRGFTCNQRLRAVMPEESARLCQQFAVLSVMVDYLYFHPEEAPSNRVKAIYIVC